MMFNNPYAAYQQPFNPQFNPQMFQQQSAPPPQQNQPVDDRIFVANEAAADAYLVAPGGFVRLWDSSTPRFFEKQADNSGRQFPVVVYEYKRIDKAQDQSAAVQDYESRFKAIEERLAAFENKKPKQKKIVEVDDDDDE